MSDDFVDHETKEAARVMLACPFCGNEDVDVSWEEAHSTLAHVYCYNAKCRMEGPFGESLEKAVERWNTRASHTEPLDEAANVLYGVCLENWGHPDDWPEDRQAVRTYRKLKALIERARTPGPKSCITVTEFPANMSDAPRELYRIQSLGPIATETGIPLTELRRLLRAGIISGDKIGGIWITTVAVVKTYQAEARTPEEEDDG